MSNAEKKLYDVGALRSSPERLYDICVMFSQFYDYCMPVDDSEVWDVLSRVNHSLWGALPHVVTIDLTDPDVDR